MFDATHDFTPSESARSLQCSLLLTYLLVYGEICTIHARDDLGILSPAARIYDLRKDGHNIRTVRGYAYDTQGRKHPNAVYVLAGGAA